MKTKTSKRVLSFILAVMMVVTSIPMMAFTAFGDEAVAVDPAVKEVQDAMDALEAKLATSGAFTNVDVAYNAYVDCQKALDAYIYGGETGALSGKAAALTNATNNIAAFTGKTGTKIPTFPAWDSGKTAEESMAGYAGTGFNNILYANTAESIGSAYNGQYVGFKVLMSTDIAVLYDGSNDILIPVMTDAYKGTSAEPSVNVYGNWTESGTMDKAYDATRHFYAAYPSANSSGTTDDSNFDLVGYWRSGAGQDANWNWNWWSNSADHDPSYNVATGCPTNGAQSVDHRSSHLVLNRGSYKAGKGYPHTSEERYFSNTLKYKGGDFDGAGKTVTIPYWFGSAGNDPNSTNDSMSIANTKPIYVVNYKYLTDNLAKNGNKMKLVDLNDFSEGGLSDYIKAMEDATDFDPNTYFTSSNNYSGCVQQITTLVSNMNNASVTNTNSADYADLRSAMADNVRGVFAGGNTGYTDDSWKTFVEKYEAAKAIMANCNDAGYTSTSAATAASELVTAYNNLETNAVKADTTALEAAIDKFEAFNNIFTTDSYNAVKATVESAKVAVWGTVDDYKVPTAAPDDSTEAQTLIANQAQAVLDAITTLVISTETVISTDEGDKYTMVSALALANRITDPTDYANYATFSGAVTAANNYVATLATTPFTDYDAQLATYRAEVLKVVDAFFALKYSFVKLPDGTVTGTSTSAITTLEDHKNNNGYNWWIDFSYPGSAIVFKTTHDALTVPYGNANVTFKINIDNNISKENNALDSITINGTADANTQINSTSPTSVPPALSDGQKASYAGCLAANGFSLKNFRVTGQMNNRKTYFGTDASGNAVTGKESATDAYTKILATTEGTEKNPAWGTIALQPGAKGDSSITLTSDMSLDIPATTKKTLTGSTVPTKTNYSYLGYFGATYVWNTQPTLAFAGYAYLTSKSNNEQIASTVSVVDMSYLVDLVAQCNALVPEAEKYTEQTWSALQKALEKAQADLDYTGMTADAILTEVKNRYSNLWAKYSALEVKTFSVVFNWKNSAGKDTSKTLTVSYGDTLSMSKYVTQINAISIPGYVANNYTYTWGGEWDPALDLDAVVTADATYNAVFEATPNEASWDAFNTAKAQLLGAITDKTYSVADLTALNTEIEALTFFSYTDEQQSTIMADRQTEIDADTAKMVELKNGLTPSTIDLTAAESAGGDKDRFSAEIEIYQTVTVAGNSVIGIIYNTQDELDAALNAALTVRSYTIYLNGTAVTTVDYGTPMIVNSDGTYQANVADTHPDYSGQTVSWFYSYSAPSRNDEQTSSKYMTTAPSFGFIVKGNTYLTTTNEADLGDNLFAVKLVANLAGNSTKTFGIYYVNQDAMVDGFDASKPPTYPYYKFVGYTCDVGNVTVDENGVMSVEDDCTVITANYAIDTTHTNGFALNIYSYSVGVDVDSMLNSDAMLGSEFETSDGKLMKSNYNYNEKVDCLTEGFWLNDAGMSDVYALYTAEDPTDTSTYKFLCLGGDYSFYAYADMNIVALSEQDYNDAISSTDAPIPTVTANDSAVPVYNSDGTLEKISLVGTFALPTSYTMVECGFLFTSETGADMTVENVGTNGIARMKSSRYTCGNQFVINIKAPADGSTRTFDYVAYAIVKDSKGEQQVVYSAKNSGTTAIF